VDPGALARSRPDTGQLISDAEVAEVPYTASTRHPVTARLVVRRVRDRARGDELFPVMALPPFFTNSAEPTVDADIAHEGTHETVFADLIDGPLAHMPSGRFGANSAWILCAAIAHNLLRAAAFWPARNMPSPEAPPASPVAVPARYSPPTPTGAAIPALALSRRGPSWNALLWRAAGRGGPVHRDGGETVETPGRPAVMPAAESHHVAGQMRPNRVTDRAKDTGPACHLIGTDEDPHRVGFPTGACVNRRPTVTSSPASILVSLSRTNDGMPWTVVRWSTFQAED
jgi:hypothetical protein